MNKMIFPIITEAEQKLPYYLIGVGCDWNQENITRPEGYPTYQWIQCIKGEGELVIEEKVYRVKETYGMLLYPNIPHEYYSISKNWVVDWILFSGSQVEYFLKQVAGIEKSGVFYVSQPDILLSRIHSALSIEETKNTLKNIKCSSIIYTLLTDIMQYTSTNLNNSMTTQHARLQSLFDYIDKNFNKPLSLEAMAEFTGVTPQHLCTLFKKTMNIRIFEYINSVRIKKSKELILHNKDLQIKEVSSLSGFEDFSYFCSVFKKLEKISPGQFRRIHCY